MPPNKKIHLLRALERRDRLSEEEAEAVAALPGRVVAFRDDEEIISEGSHPTESCLVLQGFAVRNQYLEDGKRQMAAIHIAGDFVDLHGFLLKRMDHSISALGACTVLFVPHPSLKALTERHPHLTRLFWLMTTIDGAIQRTWITCMGRRSPGAHLAHLICELHTRMHAVQLVEGDSFEFPATQAELADMLGLSTVHVNRTLQELRASDLVRWNGSTVTIVDHGRLTEYADFDPLYLNLFSEPR